MYLSIFLGAAIALTMLASVIASIMSIFILGTNNLYSSVYLFIYIYIKSTNNIFVQYTPFINHTPIYLLLRRGLESYGVYVFINSTHWIFFYS